MIIRPAVPTDLAEIGEIQRASPEAAQWPLGDYLNYTCLVAEHEGAVIGFLIARQLAPDEHELLNLAVRPDGRRRGTASALWSRAAEIAQTTWFLEVRESNSPAIRFYEKHGFRPAGRRENYYTEPPESAIVMVLQK